MNIKFKKIIIMQEFYIQNKICVKVDITKVKFNFLSSEEKKYILDCIKANKILEISKFKNIKMEKQGDFKQIFYLKRKKFSDKKKNMKIFSSNPYNYKNNKKKSYNICTSKMFGFFYNVAKFFVLVMIIILLYLMLCFKNIKWPKNEQNENEEEEKNHNKVQCCDCDEVKNKNKEIENSIQESIKELNKHKIMENNSVVFKIEDAIDRLGITVPKIKRAQEEKINTQIASKLNILEDRIKVFGSEELRMCDCEKVKEKIDEFVKTAKALALTYEGYIFNANYDYLVHYGHDYKAVARSY